MNVEMIFGADGLAGLTKRGVSQVLGVSYSAITEIFRSEILFTPEEGEVITRQGVRGNDLSRLCAYFQRRRVSPAARQRCKELLATVSDFQAFINGLVGSEEPAVEQLASPQQLTLAMEEEPPQSHRFSEIHNEPIEFIFGDDGHAGLSRKKTAELLKVSTPTISKLLVAGVKLFTPEEVETITRQGFRGVYLAKLAGYFSQAKRVNPETKQHCTELLQKAAVIGLQTFIDQLAGVAEVKQPQLQPPAIPPTPRTEVIKLRPNQPAHIATAPQEIRMQFFSTVCGLVEGVGVAESIEKQFKLKALGSIFPEYKQLADDGANAVKNSATVPDSSNLLIPTDIGRRLGEMLGCETIQPWVVNRAARDMGWQTCRREKKRNIWELTEEGKKHATVVLWADGEGHSGPQIRWYDSTLPEFAQYFRSQWMQGGAQ